MGLHISTRNISQTVEAQFQLAQALNGQDDSEKQLRAQEIFAKLLPIAREGSQTEDEAHIHGYTYIVGNLQSPSLGDVKRALDANRQVLGQKLNRVYRLRNLYAGALVHNQAGNTEQSKALLEEVLENAERLRLVGSRWRPGLLHPQKRRR